jgi:cell wall-associated NlpC family hydrolase
VAKTGAVAAVAGVGALMIYSGISNAGVLASIRDIIQGNQPAPGSAQFSSGGSTASPQSLNELGTAEAIGGGSSQASAIVAYAVAQVGKPYIYGGDGPEGYDCSGLCYEAYLSVGITIPRTTFVQIVSGTGVPVAEAQPADLLFPEPGHVVMCIGPNQCVEARHTGTTIWTRSYSNSEFMACRRFL